MLKQASRDGHAKICLGVLAPAMRERPYGLRVGFDKLADTDDRLPSGIALSFGRWRAGKNRFGAGNGTT
jgi:hypothetical protein